ncbi:MAG TPA: methyltransferase [Methylomirabilota bacterium]|jgi:ubiquinone/menaquinone biosynthesis C-methylase UbiE
MTAITDVRGISTIAYGFMASKALFAALNLDLFSRLADGPKSLEALAAESGIAPTRLLSLLTACVSLGLLETVPGGYANAPASTTYLVRSAPGYFGDYYRLQIDRQVYPALTRLDDALRGARVDFYGLMQDTVEAERFSAAQDAGSRGPARVLAKLVDLDGSRTLLDVGGGTGAFSVALCRRYPELTATILDFPNVRPLAERCIAAAGLEDRITFVGGDALHTKWLAPQDVVVASYLLSAIAAGDGERVVAEAFKVLRPGGRLIVHDFMVEDDRTGPAAAALWLLTAVVIDPEAPSLTPGSVAALMARHGLEPVAVHDVVPGITKAVIARKPGG